MLIKIVFPYNSHSYFIFLFKRDELLMSLRRLPFKHCETYEVAGWDTVILTRRCLILQLSSIVIADIDEGTVTLHQNAKIPRLPTYATDMYKFRYLNFCKYSYVHLYVKLCIVILSSKIVSNYRCISHIYSSPKFSDFH